MLKIGVLAGAAAALLIGSAPLAQTTSPPGSGTNQPYGGTGTGTPSTGTNASSGTPAPAAPYSDSGTGLPSSDWTGDRPAVSASKKGTDTSAHTGKSVAQCKAMPQDQRIADPDCRKTMKSNSPQ
ncbi:MAG TPA: hypothetical protein VHY34_01620 [Caulobacteraceae bacterium]|jgi:hypothetical protein|nr:hypothetical protein [Caulobacteraceae bacterium]